jgi:hypothetical protein
MKHFWYRLTIVLTFVVGWVSYYLNNPLLLIGYGLGIQMAVLMMRDDYDE